MPDGRRLVTRFEQLTEVPAWVFDRTALEFLCVSDNRLTGVSDKIARLTNLKALDIAHNAIESVPDALGELANLSDYL
jgi:Leucine-rich repeat (LRR) protein